VLSMVSPIVILSCGILRVAPSNKQDKILAVYNHKPECSPLLRLVFFPLDSDVEAFPG
jgi:hypothetical protein